VNGLEGELRIQRILVALDASSQSRPALETAAELASRLGAELIGLFVEDINVLRVAELPFAMEVGPFSALSRRLQVPELERQFRAQAALMRRALAAIAERMGVPWDFRIARGTVALEILSAEAEADLVIVGKGRWPMRRRLGSTTQTVVFKGRGLTLVLHEGRTLTVPVVAVYDGSVQGEKALEAAGQLVKAKDGSLSVLVVASDAASAQKLEESARGDLYKRGQQGEVRVMIRPTLPRLVFAVQGMGPVVLPSTKEFLCDEPLCEFISIIRNPVLLVR
jgi:nucleotide-binding universal stress UspA family protein